jgi:adenosylhomocysteine nucleosidase
MRITKSDFLVLISAGAEWREILPLFPGVHPDQSPYGEYFVSDVFKYPVIFSHGGWGKVASAGATQYAIDRWDPDLLINLGTCGGVEGLIDHNTLILAEETVIYDIIEGMSSYQKAIDHYTTRADLDWLGDELPFPVKRTKLYSADRDIRPEDVSGVLSRFGAVAVDWESGAFAWVCARNRKSWLELRGVTDLVSSTSGEALGNVAIWHQRIAAPMQAMLSHLPWLLERYKSTH